MTKYSVQSIRRDLTWLQEWQREAPMGTETDREAMQKALQGIRTAIGEAAELGIQPFIEREMSRA